MSDALTDLQRDFARGAAEAIDREILGYKTDRRADLVRLRGIAELCASLSYERRGDPESEQQWRDNGLVVYAALDEIRDLRAALEAIRPRVVKYCPSGIPIIDRALGTQGGAS